MAEISDGRRALLHRLYYDEKFLVGYEKLYVIAQAFPNPPTRRAVADWLKDQKVHQLHLKPKRTSGIKPVLVDKPNSVYQMDLIDMGDQRDRQFRYILGLIDCFTRYAYALPLVNKEMATVSKAFEKLFFQYDLYMRVLQTDNGAEFKADLESFLEGHSIKHLTGIAGRPESQGIIERWNGTIKSMMYKNMMVTGSKRWTDDLQELVRVYNDTPHDTLDGVSPSDVNDENRQALADMIRARAAKSNVLDQDDLEVGDTVRIKIFKGVLEKASTPNWSEALYTVSRVVRSKKPFVRLRYTIVDDNDVKFKNNYPRNDLQKITATETRYGRLRHRKADNGNAAAPRTSAPAHTMSLRARAPRAEPKPTQQRRTPAEVQKEKDQQIAEQTAGKLATKAVYKFKPL